eukprot:163752_1
MRFQSFQFRALIMVLILLQLLTRNGALAQYTEQHDDIDRSEDLSMDDHHNGQINLNENQDSSESEDLLVRIRGPKTKKRFLLRRSRERRVKESLDKDKSNAMAGVWRMLSEIHFKSENKADQDTSSISGRKTVRRKKIGYSVKK